MKVKRVIVHGLVQGVFFRRNCLAKAKELDCKGYVQNLPDGTVEVVVSGQRAEELIEWCKQGPEAARVDSINVIEMEVDEEFSDFERKN